MKTSPMALNGRSIYTTVLIREIPLGFLNTLIFLTVLIIGYQPETIFGIFNRYQEAADSFFTQLENSPQAFYYSSSSIAYLEMIVGLGNQSIFSFMSNI
jgi:hypothetical protein